MGWGRPPPVSLLIVPLLFVVRYRNDPGGRADGTITNGVVTAANMMVSTLTLSGTTI